MAKIGRNNPCPCGSGRKYKACCGAEGTAPNFQFHLYRRLHAELIPRLVNFMENSLGPEFVEAGWDDFICTETSEVFDPEGAMRQLFMPWLLFNLNLEFHMPRDSEFSQVTVAELFLVENRNRLTTGEQDFLLSSVRCPYTLCEVMEVKPQVGMTLFDLLRRVQYEVVERTASQTIKKGEIIYCATSDFHGFISNIGTGPYPLRPTSKADVLELLEWMVDEAGTEKITSERLLEFEDDIRWLYLDLVAARLAPPVLVNSDGHRLVPQKLYFDVDSANEAFHALKFLADEEDEEGLLEDAIVEDGIVKSVEFPWLGGTKKARKKLGGPVLLGSLTIKDKRLVVEVNSTERAGKILKIVEKRLAGCATYKRTVIELLESQMREMWQSSGAGGAVGSVGSLRAEQSGFLSADDAEVREKINEIARQHWENWLDEPIPALDHLTPKEAARTEKGRDLLESLLLEYEIHASATQDAFNPDIKALRRKLRMEKKLFQY